MKNQNMQTSADSFFKKAQGIDFSDDFFHASGAGRVRIRNVLKALIGLPGVSDAAITEVVERLVSARKI